MTIVISLELDRASARHSEIAYASRLPVEEHHSLALPLINAGTKVEDPNSVVRKPREYQREEFGVFFATDKAGLRAPWNTFLFADEVL